MLKIKSSRLVVALLAASLLGVVNIPSASAAEDPGTYEYYRPYENVNKTATTGNTPSTFDVKPAAFTNADGLSRYALSKSSLNGTVASTFTPRVKVFERNATQTDRGRWVTKTRPVYGWVTIGRDRALSYEGHVLYNQPYSHPNMQYHSYFRTYLWAGNNTTSNGYGAHDQPQGHLDGRSTYEWMNLNCDSSMIYTPSYNGWWEFRGGFYDAAIHNPYGSGFRGDQARGGIVGGDPLMRWSGAMGYGWYYDCYSTDSIRYQQTGTETYQEWEPNLVWEGRWVERARAATTAEARNIVSGNGPATGVQVRQDATTTRVYNLSTVNLTCSVPGTNTVRNLGTKANAPFGNYRLSTVSGTTVRPNLIKVSEYKTTTPNKKDYNDKARLEATTAGTTVFNATIPQDCYGKVSVKVPGPYGPYDPTTPTDPNHPENPSPPANRSKNSPS